MTTGNFSLHEKSKILRNSVAGLLSLSDNGLKPQQHDALTSMLMHTPDEIARSYFKLPTGFGKTIMFVLMARAYIDSLTRTEQVKNRVVILVPRLVLTDQTIEKLSEFAEISGAVFHHNLSQASRRAAMASNIVVSTYHSMENLIDAIGMENVGLVIADEAHHAIGAKRMEYLQRLGTVAPIVGFTATPTFSDNRSVRDLLGTELCSINIKDGVESGVLCPVKNVLYRTSVVFDASNVPTGTSGDFDYDKLSSEIKLDVMADEIAKIYVHGGDGDIRFCDCRAMINCPNIKTAEIQAEKINTVAGRPIAHAIHSASPDFAKIKSDFMNGKYNVVCQVNTLTEGFDDPTVSLCINYPSRSAVKIEQAGGRVIRTDEKNPSKIAYVLDTIFRSRSDEPLDDVLQTAAAGRQVLFRNVADGIVVTPRDFVSRTSHVGHPNVARSDNDFTAGKFDVITDNKKLLSLEHKYIQFVAANTIGKKTSQWLNANDLSKLIAGGSTKIRRAMGLIYGGDMLHGLRLEMRCSGNATGLCLHRDDVNLFTAVAKKYGYEFRFYDASVGVKDAQWLGATDLSEYVIGNHGKVIHAMRDVFSSGKYPNVRMQMRMAGPVLTLCLHRESVDAFIVDARDMGYVFAVRDSNIGDKTSNWLNVDELSEYVIGTRVQMRDALRAVYNSDKFSSLNLQPCRNGAHRRLCVARDSVDDFVMAARSLGYDLQILSETIQEKTSQWLAAEDLRREYILGAAKHIGVAMRAIFDSDKKNLLRLSFCRAKPRCILCLHRDDVKSFVSVACEMGYPLALRDTGIGDKTAQWLSSVDLHNLFRGESMKIISAMRVVHESNKFPNIRMETRRSGTYLSLCLHRDDVSEFVNAADVMGYKLTRRDNALGSKTPQWVSANELCRYISSTTRTITRALQNVYASGRFSNLRLQLMRSGAHTPLCIHHDDIAAFVAASCAIGCNLKLRDGIMPCGIQKTR